jgi:hypothetical protein
MNSPRYRTQLASMGEVLVHEGQHGVDSLSKGMPPAGQSALLAFERDAYRLQLAFAQSLGYSLDLQGANKEYYIKKSAIGSMTRICSYMVCDE